MHLFDKHKPKMAQYVEIGIEVALGFDDYGINRRQRSQQSDRSRKQANQRHSDRPKIVYGISKTRTTYPSDIPSVTLRLFA